MIKLLIFLFFIPVVATAQKAKAITVILDGTGSRDPDGFIVKYKWVQISGAKYTITNSDSVKATVTLPPGVYSFQLTVTDNSGGIGKDTVVKTIKRKQ